MNEEEVFVEAIEIADRAQRRAFLDKACAGNASLRSSVDQLLSMHDTAGDFLETPVLGASPPTDAEGPGTRIDRYRLLEKIGEGGFGDVWKAEQTQPVRRLVALKVIKPGMDTRRVIARFEAERQVLAIMNHRNIAAVLDAGSTLRGRPYFVMELVDGLPIDEYCDRERLTVPERLRLFSQICLAVQHAHQKGIVHRDLKPSNILVAVNDKQANPKVIDFGIAKAMQNPVGVEISATSPQQLMGTPEYMSPEQMAGETDIDTRADIYALGGVLYKLLVGVAPLDAVALRQRGLDELSRAIREDDAPRPSTRVLRLEAPSQVASLRSTQTKTLCRALRGDLDAIVSRALAKERSRRYGSASDLGADIDRHLACLPIAAASPGLLYRSRKFFRRNRAGVLATSLALIASVIGIIALASADRARQNEASLKQQAALKEKIADYQRRVAQEQRRAAAVQTELAQSKAKEALRLATLLEGVVGLASPRGGKNVDFTARHIVDDLAKSIGQELDDYPEIEARLRRTIGRAYLDLIEIKTAGKHLKRALDLRLQLHPTDHPTVLESRVDYALFLIANSRVDQAEDEISKALPALRRTGPTEPLVRSLECLRRIRQVQEDFANAQQSATEAWQLATNVYGKQDVRTLEYQCEAGFAAYLAARSRKNPESQLSAAEQLVRSALGELTTNWPDRRFEIDSARMQLAQILTPQGHLVEAKRLAASVIAHRRITLGEDSKHLVSDLLVMARILIAEDDLEEAENVARAALAMAERVNDERQQIRALVFYRLSTIVEHNRPEESADWHGKAIDAWHSCLGNHLRVAIQRRGLAEQLRSLGRWREAESSLLQSLKVLDHHPNREQARGLTHHRIADLLRSTGDPERAVTHFRLAIGHHEAGKTFSILAYLDYIQTLIELEELEQAEQEFQAWLADTESIDSPLLAIMTRACETQLMIANREYEEANQRLRLIARKLKNAPRMQARVMGLLARCLTQQQDFEPAEQILMRQAGDKATSLHPLEPRRVARQLVELYEAWNKPNEADQWREQTGRSNQPPLPIP